MFDLQSGVHFQEIELLALVEEKLDRSRVLIACRSGDLHRDVSHLDSSGRCDGHGRTLFDDLLMAALDRAFAFTQVNDVAVLIAEIWISM